MNDALPMSGPELLAPAGDWDCLRAAVENGANAVYLGLDSGFNARARATNFDLQNVDRVMDFLHRRCVSGYVTLNTLAFTDELPRLEDVIRRLAEAQVDAVLVQDFGVARLVKAISPDLALHASTQMTLTSGECIEAARSLGIERVVLPRELSIDEIRNVRQQTDMPLETFVHGALCVAYSGQCLTSESLGGRSANRGQCAQACRMSYDLICDGQDVALGDQKYLLSPQDLAAYALTADLIDAGVCSFKIEGRLKTAEYVANTVQHYRAAIDAAVAGQSRQFSAREINDVEMSFSRGFSPGWLEGCDHKMLVPATSSTKRGVLLGTVESVRHGSVTVQLESFVAAGDGVVFEGDRETDSEQGGRVFEVLQGGQPVSGEVEGGIAELTFDRSGVNLEELQPGLRVWKTDDPRLNRRLRATFSGPDARRRVPLTLTVTAAVGQPLVVQAFAASGAGCQLTSDEPLEQARRHPLTEATLREQLGRLGATVYRLDDVRARIDGQPMVPLSVLGLLRRRMIEELNEADLRPPYQVAPDRVLPALQHQITAPRSDEPVAPVINVLCRNLNQLSSVLAVMDELSASTAPPSSTSPRFGIVYVDFADIREYRQAVQLGRDAGRDVWPATPRIQKPGEIGLFRAMQKHDPPGVLVRNLAGLAFFQKAGLPVVGDFSFNVTNELTADYLIGQGLQRVAASYDMNRDQLLDLVQVVPPQWLEIVIHQHMPMFHMEHCVFCSVLSPGTNKTNCGRPCDFHKVELRDRIGMEHPLTADVGCRNTLFNATPQSSAEVTPLLQQRALFTFRIELLYDEAPRIRKILTLYRQLLAGEINGGEVWTQLQASNRVGVTRGTLEERRNPLAIL
ncbi:MAG: U32 family peptidase [Planctomycetaceae bacterium]|nr:U32 family peptidase [Planctomycetaceae bacterium]